MYHHGLRASEPGKLMLSDHRPGPGKRRLRVLRLKGVSRELERTVLRSRGVRAPGLAARAWHEAGAPLFCARKHRPLCRLPIRRLHPREHSVE
jgi:hypothetical protein